MDVDEGRCRRERERGSYLNSFRVLKALRERNFLTS
jgi:hypothetical protein